MVKIFIGRHVYPPKILFVPNLGLFLPRRFLALIYLATITAS